MSKKNWVKRKKDLSESDTAVKKEKTLEEKRGLAKREIVDVRQDVVKSEKKEIQEMRQDVVKSDKKKNGMRHRSAEYAKKKAVSAVKATGTVAKATAVGLTGVAGKIIEDTEVSAGGSPEGNISGVLAEQVNRNSIIHKKNKEKKKPDTEKKIAGTKTKNTVQKVGEKSISVVKTSVIGMTATTGQMIHNVESSAGGSTEGNAFSVMVEQMTQTRQMIGTLGSVPKSFKNSAVKKSSDKLSQMEKVKHCCIKTENSSTEIQIRQNSENVKKHVLLPEEKEKKICSTEEREKRRKRKKKKDRKKKPGKISKTSRIVRTIASFFNSDMADNILNVLKFSAPFLILLDIIFTVFITVLLIVSGFITTASEAARHPISFFLENSEEETGSEDYLRTVVRKKETEFDKEIEDFLAEDANYHEVLYDRGLQNDWSVWEDSICIAYLARIFTLNGEDLDGTDAAYPLLHVDTDKEKEVLEEIFRLMHFIETSEIEIQVPDGTETVENTYYMTVGSNLPGMRMEDHVCGFSHRDAYENWDRHYIPCIVSEKSGFELGTVLQAVSDNQMAGLKYQVVGFDEKLEDYTISICQNLKTNKNLYPCVKDFTLLSGKRTIQEEVEQTVYKTVTKKIITVYHYSLSEWQSMGIRGNFPSDEESEVVDDMYSLLE